jgi:hypothetical protein
MDQVQSIRMQPGFRQIIQLRQANLLQLPDDEFHKLVAEVEQSPLFRRFYRREKLVHYRRLPGANIYPRFYQLQEGMCAATDSLDVESLLSGREDLVPLIENLGPERFKRYFLFPEDSITAGEIADACRLTSAEIQAINSFINDFVIMSEFYRQPPSASPAVAYTKIASIEKCGGEFAIGYFSPFYARGRYIIDYAGFEKLLTGGSITADETKETKRLLKKLELINYRKDTIHKMLTSLISKQKMYLESGNPLSLLSFSQKELAAEVGLAPSSVSRAVRWRSVLTPWEEEIPLKYLLPTARRFKKEMVRQLLENEPGIGSDEAARLRLREKLGIAISRRSFSELRRELKIPARRHNRESKEIR